MNLSKNRKFAIAFFVKVSSSILYFLLPEYLEIFLSCFLPLCSSYCCYKSYLLLLFITSVWLVNSDINNYQITEKLFNKSLTLLKILSVEKINTSDKVDQVSVKFR